jgi:hypothetical protein
LGDAVTERIAVLTAVLTKLRFGMSDALTRGQPVPDWELRMWVREIDALKADEMPEERVARVRHTGVLALIEEEIDLLSDPQWARDFRARAKRIAECPGHEAEAEPADAYQRRSGWHPAHCKHCGKDMSVDSGD